MGLTRAVCFRRGVVLLMVADVADAMRLMVVWLLMVLLLVLELLYVWCSC